MSDTKITTDHKLNSDSLDSIFHVRWAVRLVGVFLAMMALLSFAAFAYQVQCENFDDPFHGLFRNTRGAWLHLAGHLLRGGLCAWLLWHIAEHLRALKELESQTQRDYARLFRAVSRWWVALGLAFIAMFVFATVTMADRMYGISDYFAMESSRVDPSIFRKTKDRVAFCEADDAPREGFVKNWMLVTEPIEKTIYVKETPIVENQDIAGAAAIVDSNGKPAIEIRLTRGGAQKLMESTTHLIDRKIAVVINDKVITAATITSPLSDSVVVSGHFTSDRVRELVESINETE